jgi:hypothetical protein
VLRGMHVAQVVAHISVGLRRSLDVVAMCHAGFACSSQSVAGVAATMWSLQVLMHASVGQALGRFRHRFGALGRCMCCYFCCVLGALHRALLVQCGLLLHEVHACAALSGVPFSHPCCWLVLPPQQSSLS